MPNNVRIKKEELLTILRENLEVHKLVYEKGMILFKENYIHRLGIMLSGAQINEFEMHVNLSKPELHSSDYERAIRMVELECNPEVVLEEHEFAQCVMNQWDWFRTFKSSYTSNCLYSSSSSSSGPSTSSSSSDDERIQKYLDGK